MAENETNTETKPKENETKPPENNTPNPPNPPPPPPAEPPKNGPTQDDFASLTALVGSIPERVAAAVREAMPKTNPPKETKTDPPKDNGDSGNGTGTKRQQTETVPGKREVHHTFLGIPWD